MQAFENAHRSTPLILGEKQWKMMLNNRIKRNWGFFPPIKFSCGGKRTTSESLSFSYGFLRKSITSFDAIHAPGAISVTLLGRMEHAKKIIIY